ncbi:hypothetical protein BOTBODRAFT_175228 [Botryobasidium botryosum FD-172 SS1]|uniref:F-box domain-containing protein n=1 Tax=Botryobasidium botryosum (strain FD-172 SS1) TaxID=930990 RepID=A0A067MDH4_BOTB1|nr:hypothetical protein BOTBODRAFT_175228 [Botryobasidium botryosum FD-172 SS1]
MAPLTITSVPLEIVTGNILLCLPLRDLVAISCCNKQLSTLCNSDTLWKRKLKFDYDFSVPRNRPLENVSYKAIYQRVCSPWLFVWKCGHIPFPSREPPNFSELRIGARMVSFVAACSAFYALDDKGGLYAWGEESCGPRRSRSKFPFGTEVPSVRLELPNPIKSISIGTSWINAVDSLSQVWFIPDWHQAYRIVDPVLERLSSEALIAQVESGWRFTAILAKSGELHIVYCRLEDFFRRRPSSDCSGNIITTDISLRLATMPPLPALPAIKGGAGGSEEALPPKLVQVATSELIIIGLTDQGHVLQAVMMAGGEPTLFEALERGKILWNYLPFFSEAEKVRMDSMYTSPGTDARTLDPLNYNANLLWRITRQFPQSARARPYSRVVPTPPSTLKIDQVLISGEHICAYSSGPSSTVLLGNANNTDDLRRPKVLPTHQNYPVARFVVTDHDSVFLTPEGRVMGWNRDFGGEYVEEPCALVVPGSKKGWLFLSIAAEGCHIGGLAIEWEEEAVNTRAIAQESESEGEYEYEDGGDEE